jgi:hypothetical protein
MVRVGHVILYSLKYPVTAIVLAVIKRLGVGG